MKLFISTLLFLLTISLSACVSEEGASKHTEKGHAIASKVGMIPGMMWKAVVYKTTDAKHTELGKFESRDECQKATQEHMTGHQQPKKGHLASACMVVKSRD